ncbi:carbon-nitrogen hydrolase family protein [Rothia uropygialis]|uniref:carbon-nitrogen hydrolase family protein n=1 Tax=Kocuria sp. 36 TaxID=1415402 RepID=UPI00101D063D|nr:carbon-nitrogen hydrolase family protein [Kocuria sp. 36]
MTTSDSQPVRIALLQTEGSPGDVEANLQELREAAERAAQAEAGLLLTPEMFVTGYNIGGQLSALTALPLTESVAEIARVAGVAIAAGLPLTADGGIVNSVALFDRQGQQIARYDKTHLFGDLDRSMFSAGSAPSPIIDFEGLKLGMLICYDVEFPETVRSLALQGADAVLVPTAQMAPYAFIAERTIPSRAWESQIYVAYANHVGAEGDLTYVGRSSVTAPDGEILTMAGEEPELLFAELDPKRVRASREENPYLNDRRPDLYTA